MQTLDVISVNLWQIIISLLNLLVLFLILKYFLYKPVTKMLDKRREEIDSAYAAADRAEKDAFLSRDKWQKKLSGAEDEANAIIKDAATKAELRSDKILSDTRDKADTIIRQAQTEAELEMKKAREGIKREIIDVSSALSEKLLGREINEQDHRSLIDSFIEEIGDNDGNK